MKTEEMPAESMTVAEMFVRALEHEGVEYVFGIPGEENLDLINALHQSKQIQVILSATSRVPPLWRMCTDV